jgi:hypothetical protein
VDDVVTPPVPEQMPKHAEAEAHRGPDPTPAADVELQSRPDLHDPNTGKVRPLAGLPLPQRQVRDLESLRRQLFGQRAVPALTAADGVGVEAVVDEADVQGLGRPGRQPTSLQCSRRD